MICEHFSTRRPAPSGARENLSKPAPFRIWGKDLDPNSDEQMDNACSLPNSVAGALMPRRSSGYGLPIGGVLLAVRKRGDPLRVGVDIACRMKLSVLDLPPSALENRKRRTGSSEP
jgi:tRNA-splicing ligase RtcB